MKNLRPGWTSQTTIYMPFVKKVCQKSFSIGSSGIDTIREHVKGKRHLERIKSAA